MSFFAGLPIMAGAATAGAGGIAGLVTPILGTGVAGTSSFLGLGVPTWLQFGGLAMEGFGALNQAVYTAKQMEENARIMRENAMREADRIEQEQQDQDMLARIALGEELVEQAASGFSLDSSTLARSRERNALVARTNSQRLREDGEIIVRNLLKSTGTAPSPWWPAIAAGLNFGTTLVTAGNTATRRKLLSLGIG